MDDEQSLLSEPQARPSTAAEAFARLEARVAAMELRMDGRMAMMTRALEHIAIEKQTIEIPDYNPTLGKISGHLADMGKRVKAMEESPAMEMTPEAMAGRISKAAEAARQADNAAFRLWDRALDEKVRMVETIIGTANTWEQQKSTLWMTGYIVGLTAFLSGIFLPVIVFQQLPGSWHRPEKMAAWVMGEPTLAGAGVRLLRLGDPEGWDTVTAAARMRRENRDAIAACEHAAIKARKPLQCSINIQR
ncbi:DUF6118 family protein [Sphingomonas sp. dw_22]|uniref:DUF6118 family protein n=1 Tax=Sphingomonas sp. dw_22 TaxID=2721175 RepID=UPI001BD5621B|nr:DUF6118 family protein [Sphingomonas sp. dw_22]